jgi:hypothetical protein
MLPLHGSEGGAELVAAHELLPLAQLDLGLLLRVCCGLCIA